MMTRKHFQAIAEIIEYQTKRHGIYKDEASVAAYRAAEEIADELADLFATENPNFDRTRFLTACGL